MRTRRRRPDPDEERNAQERVTDERARVSPRARLRRLARTIADMVGSDVIKTEGLRSGGGDAIQIQTTGELGGYNHCYPNPRVYNNTLSSNHG